MVEAFLCYREIVAGAAEAGRELDRLDLLE